MTLSTLGIILVVIGIVLLLTGHFLPGIICLAIGLVLLIIRDERPLLR